MLLAFVVFAVTVSASTPYTCSVTLRVVTLPSSGFDGNTSVTFSAGGMASSVASSASFNVTFFHCEIGQVWNSTAASLDRSDADTTKSCQLCVDVVQRETGVGGGVCCGLIDGLPIRT